MRYRINKTLSAHVGMDVMIVFYPVSFFVFQSNVPVDIMPGEFDPTNGILPQQPLHKCMFPKANAYPTLNCVTNPYEADIAGCR